jgi:PAS domain S-box-containing protein
VSEDARVSATPKLDPRQFRRLLKRAIIPPLLLLLGCALVLAWQVSNLLGAYSSKDHSDRVIALAENLSSQLLQMQGGLRGYMLSGDPAVLDRYERSLKSMEPAAQQLAAAVRDNDAQAQRVAELGPLLDQWKAHSESLRGQTALQVRIDPRDVTVRGKRLMDNLQVLLSGIVSSETSLRDTRRLAIRRAALATLGLGGAIAVVLGLVIAFVARKQLLTVASNYEDALTISFLQVDQIEQRENLLSLIADTIPSVITYIGADLRYQFANSAFERYRGISREQVRGRHLRDVLGEVVFQRIAPQLELALKQGRRITFDAVTLFPRMGERELHVDYLPHRGPGGAVAGMVAILTDITERNAAQRELARSEQRYRNFIHQSSEGIWRMELDRPIPTSASIDEQIDLLYQHGYLAECNDAMARMYGRSRAEELIGARLGSIISRDDPDSIAYLRAFIQNGYRLGDHDFREPERPSASGRCYVYNLIGHVENKQLVRCWATQRDITDRKLAEQQRDALLSSERAARADAERAGRMKDEFLSMLSHELRTPLNAILGWAQLLRREDVSGPDLAQGLESIERNSRAQAQIIEDLLDMSRIVAGKVRLEIRTVELSEVVDAAMDTVGHAARAKGVTIGKRVEGNEPLVVMGDENRLQQVVWNLLSNAIKFTPTGGRVDVSLRADSARRVAELVVCDTGIGIRSEFLPHVFERFRQADSSSTRSHGGLGLGLAIVRQMVEMHEGTVSAESAGEGHGSVFRIELPLGAATPAKGAVLRSGPMLPSPMPMVTAGGASTRVKAARAPFATLHRQLSARATLAGLNLLIVDDEPDALELFRRMLSESGAAVTCASSADEAMDRIKRERPNVLVSDIGMPGHDGYWLIERVRRLEQDAGAKEQMPAVALTAFAGPQDRLRAIQAGFQVHLPKPVQGEDLVRVVASAAGRRMPTA